MWSASVCNNIPTDFDIQLYCVIQFHKTICVHSSIPIYIIIIFPRERRLYVFVFDLSEKIRRFIGQFSSRQANNEHTYSENIYSHFEFSV